MKFAGKRPILSVLIAAGVVMAMGLTGGHDSLAGTSAPVAPKPSVLTIPLAVGEGVSRQDVMYHCENAHGDTNPAHASEDEKRLWDLLPKNMPFQVSYYNADMTALAALPLDSKIAVFANVMAGSGAKYVAERYIWWAKGDDVDFSAEDRDAHLTCHAVLPPGEQNHNNGTAKIDQESTHNTASVP